MLIRKEVNNMSENKEYVLAVKFRDAKEKLEALKLQTSEAQQALDSAERQLIELLQEQGKDATARYEGFGYVSINKPRLYANCTKENLDQLLEFLHSQQREDLIQTVVYPQSLSTFTKELLEEGKEIPACISYYLKPTVRYNGV